jgi:hypothetical protein
MRIRLDEADFPLDGAVVEVGKRAVFEAAKQEALSRGRVIVDIVVDGESVNDEEVFFSLSGGIDIQFLTQPVRELVGESVAEGLRYLPRLQRGLDEVATRFEEGRDAEAQSAFAQAIEGINWLIDVFNKSCMLLGISSAGLRSGRFEQDFEALRDALEALVAAMEAGKSMSLAYLIREKLLPAIDAFAPYWQEISDLAEGRVQ